MKAKTSYTAYNFGYQPETTAAADKLKPGMVSTEAHWLGMNKCEPIIIMLDSLIRYAKAYQDRFEGKLQADSVLGDAWLGAAINARKLLNGDGAVAMELDRTADSKDNGACESMFWQAMEIAGFTEADMNQ